jgi:hypothetical protein
MLPVTYKSEVVYSFSVVSDTHNNVPGLYNDTYLRIGPIENYENNAGSNVLRAS